MTCQICMSPGQTEENPLLRTCKCSTVCRHYLCLKRWLLVKCHKIENEGQQWEYRQFT